MKTKPLYGSKDATIDFLKLTTPFVGVGVMMLLLPIELSLILGGGMLFPICYAIKTIREDNNKPYLK